MPAWLYFGPGGHSQGRKRRRAGCTAKTASRPGYASASACSLNGSRIHGEAVKLLQDHIPEHPFGRPATPAGRPPPTTECDMASDTQRDIERLADTAAAAVAACGRLARSPRMTEAERADLGLVREYVIEQTAASVQLARETEAVEAILYGTEPGLLLAALRRNLTPGQRAHLGTLLRDDRP